MDRKPTATKPEKRNRVNSQPATPAPRNVQSRAGLHALAASPAQGDTMSRKKTMIGVLTILQEKKKKKNVKLIVACREKSDDKTKEKSDDKTKKKSDDKTKKKSDDKTKKKSDDKTKEKSDDKTKENSDDKTKEKSDDKTKEKSEDKTKEKSDDKTKENSDDKTKEKSDDKTKEKSDDKTKEKSDDKNKEKSDDKTKEKVPLKLENIKENLRLDNTKLVISVVGGGSQFILHPRYKAFKRQLMISALNTDALIFAEGECSADMMKYVKEALHDFGLLDAEHVTAIRIVPDSTLQQDDEETILEVNDESEDTTDSISVRLGVQYKIADAIKAKMVLLLVGEDREMVPAVKKAASLKIPVIVIQGFGGLADCLSSKMKSKKGEPPDQGKRGNQASKTGQETEQKVKEEAKKYESDCTEIMKYSSEAQSSLINVCELPGDIANYDHLYKTILNALISDGGNNERESLAISWPVYSLAQEEISDRSFFEDGREKRQKQLNKLMLKALLDENTEFVDFLLDHGVSIKAFLTEYNLRKLYRKSVFGAMKSSGVTEKVPKEVPFMQDIIDMFDVLLGDIYNFREEEIADEASTMSGSPPNKDLTVAGIREAEKAQQEQNIGTGLYKVVKVKEKPQLATHAAAISDNQDRLNSEDLKRAKHYFHLWMQKKSHHTDMMDASIQQHFIGVLFNDTRNRNLTKFGKIIEENDNKSQDYFESWYKTTRSKKTEELTKKLKPDRHKGHYIDIFDEDETSQNGLADLGRKATFKYPELLLFLWAIVSSKFDMAQFLWRDVKDRLTAALIACVTLKAMKKRILNNVTFMDEKEEYTQKIAVFEGMAVAVLNRCNNEDAQKTKKLLTRIQPQWEGLTCLEIADQAKCSNFISQESCQAIADQIWKGKANKSDADDENDFFKFVRSIFYVFFAFYVVIPTFLMECGKNKRSGAYLFKSFHQIIDNFPLSVSSPAFKFYVNWFFFLGFVFLYMYVLLVRIPIDTLQIPELILFCWFFTLFIEEVRLSIVMIPHGTKGKVSYFLLNQIGFLSITNYYLGLTTIAGWLINSQSAFLHGAMCVNFIGFVCRLFFFLSINAQLGPRIFMMRRMIRDIIIFSVILIIMCFTYGVVVYSLENKGTVRELMLSSLLELPVNGFWLLLGNQPSDNANEDNTDLRIVIRGLMRVVYMMIACILMINLLIAAFSHTFNQVQEKKEEVRKFQRFQMIYRFYYQFCVPPPLSIFLYPVALCYRCCQKCCTKNSSPKALDGIKEDLFHSIVEAEDEDELLAWANAVVDTYTVGCPMTEDSVQTQVNQVIRKVQRIAKSDDGLYKYTENSDSVENLRDIGEMLKKLQESVQSLADILRARPDLQTSKT